MPNSETVREPFKEAAVQTLRYRAGALELIDQRALPQRFDYVTCKTAAEVADAIRQMVVRGAPAIGCAAAFGIALDALRGANLAAAFAILRSSRPTAVNLFWALNRMHKLCESGADADRLLSEAHGIVAEDVAVNRAIGMWGQALIQDHARVMTHCNAGALATAGHGTALGVIRSARDAGKRISVIANETRPYLQGARLTAWEMVQESIAVTLITDSMAGHLMQRGQVDVIIVGADRVAANGDVANKIGTYTLAVLAARHRVPFFVAAPLSTIDLQIASGEHIPIEERSGAEVLGFREARWAASGVSVSNPAFDITPAELVSALITERGVIRAPYAASLQRLFSDPR